MNFDFSNWGLHEWTFLGGMATVVLLIVGWAIVTWRVSQRKQPPSLPLPPEAIPPAPPEKKPAAEMAEAIAPTPTKEIPPPPPEVAPPKPGNFGVGLARTRAGFLGRLTALFRGAALDEEQWEELEALLVSADIGVQTTQELLSRLKAAARGPVATDRNAFIDWLAKEVEGIVGARAQPLEPDRSAAPYVILMVGVNGVGKTTTIGKLARLYRQQGFHPVLAAGDTFRAGAIRQLAVWGERNDVPVIHQQEGSDAAAVLHDAIMAAKARGADLVIADTAGRLHTNVNLMEELRKVKRVAAKIHPGAPHEVLMVLDATTGQNALTQLKQFHEAIGVTGLVLTKLDGTPRGGILVAIARQYEIPFRFIGVGERAEDLIAFDPTAYARALVSDGSGA